MALVSPFSLHFPISQLGLGCRLEFSSPLEALQGISSATLIGSSAANFVFGIFVLLLTCLLVYLQFIRVRERGFNAKRWSETLDQTHKSIQELETENARFKKELGSYTQLFASAGAALLRADADGVIHYANGPLLEKMGFSSEDLMGRSQLSLLSFAGRRAILSGVAGRNTLPNQYKCEVQIESPSDGGLRWVSIFGTSVKDQHDRDVFMTGVLDIHEEVQARQKNLNRRQLNKLYGVCEGLASDYQQWLRAISIYSNMIDDESLRIQICQANDKATRLTDRLLAFSQKDSDSGQVVYLTEFVNSIAPVIQNMLPNQIELRFDLRVEKNARVRIDPARLQQIFVNLVSNSQHAIVGDGCIVVTTREIEIQKNDASKLGVFPGRFVSIEISDNGKGMKAEVLERVFEPFYTTRGGIGIGLPATHDAVTKAGGAINIKSSFGEGATVRVVLPLQTELAKESSEERPLAGTYQQNVTACGQSILLVEDQEVLRMAIHRAMTAAGFVVESYEDAEEAWNVMLSGKTFDCVVSDVVLGRMSGVQLYRQIRDRYAEQKVILISGYQSGRMIDDDALLLDPLVRFIQKPFLINKVIGLLEDMNEQPSGRLG